MADERITLSKEELEAMLKSAALEATKMALRSAKTTEREDGWEDADEDDVDGSYQMDELEDADDNANAGDREDGDGEGCVVGNKRLKEYYYGKEEPTEDGNYGEPSGLLMKAPKRIHTLLGPKVWQRKALDDEDEKREWSFPEDIVAVHQWKRSIVDHGKQYKGYSYGECYYSFPDYVIWCRRNARRYRGLAFQDWVAYTYAQEDEDMHILNTAKGHGKHSSASGRNSGGSKGNMVGKTVAGGKGNKVSKGAKGNSKGGKSSKAFDY